MKLDSHRYADFEKNINTYSLIVPCKVPKKESLAFSMAQEIQTQVECFRAKQYVKESPALIKNEVLEVSRETDEAKFGNNTVITDSVTWGKGQILQL